MTVVFDLIAVQSRDHAERGIARYVLHLALALESRAPGLVDRYLVRSDLPIPTSISSLIETGRVRAHSDDRRTWDLDESGVFIIGSPFEAASVDDVLPTPYRSPRWRRMAVLYDVIPLRYPELYLRSIEARERYMARIELLRSCDQLLSISQTTADDATTYLGHGPERASVIGAGADDRFSPHPLGRAAALAEVATDPPVPGLRPGYLMNPSGIDPRKNNDRLLVAYSRIDPELRRAHQLVLVCKTTPDQAEELEERAQELGIADDLLVTGFVTDDELVRLYRGAHLVVFPSLFEGFGLPVLEAMQCGAPAICSDSSSLCEVQTDPQARFDPTDESSIAEAITRVLSDDEERERIRLLPPPVFTWDLAADETIRRISQHGARTRVGSVPRRRRVALVAPLPPMAGAVAEFSRGLAEALAEQVDVTVFVDHDAHSSDPIAGIEIQPTHLLPGIDGGGRPFDRVVTILSNGDAHVEALEIVERVGGVVVLHDTALGDLYNRVQQVHPERLPEGSVGTLIKHLYPNRYSGEVVGPARLRDAPARTFGVRLLARVAAAADQMVVLSELDATLTELDVGERPVVIDLAATEGDRADYRSFVADLLGAMAL